MRARAVNASDAPAPTVGYAQGLDLSGHDRLLFISGQIPVDVHGAVAEGFTAQCRLAWANVGSQLRAAGMDITSLVKVTIFLADRRYAVENREIRSDVLGDHQPAMTVIITGIFDDAWLLEIEAIAAA